MRSPNNKSADKKSNLTKLTKSKRAVVETQFNWVFIVIAGAMILVFFIMVINKQKDISDTKLAIEILDSIDKIIYGQKISENREDVVVISETEFSYDCGGCSCTLSIGEVSKAKGNTIIFMPSHLKSNFLAVWTQSWDMPFKIANFVYMTVPEIRYYFVKPSDSFKREFIEKLPQNLTYSIVDDANSIIYKGEQAIRIVYLDSSSIPSLPPSLKGISDPLVTALVIDNTVGEWYNGKSKFAFYKKKGYSFIEDKDEKGEYSYPAWGIQSAYGALYSDNAQSFRCNMEDALQRMEFVAAVYKSKTEKLGNDAINNVINAACSLSYGTAPFNNLLKPDLKNPANVFNSINVLRWANDNAILLSCPRIY
ncbi:MAG: hypothetical protein N3D84_01190 [Candidatus Woesearchaeota archaeon]|nr:hypothetical protein [Candidatus Woesearchaeota archaeon]